MKKEIKSFVSSSSGFQTCDSREPQIQQALQISSSRVPRTDSSRFFALLLFTTLLFSFRLSSQEATNSQYSHIKQLIISKQLNKAREELKLAMTGNENDPTLNLYQTELWIVEADSYYASGQYKRAIAIYEKAIEQYPSNPMVKMKYQEMVSKMKGLSAEANENKPVSSFPIQPIGLQGGFSQDSELAVRESRTGNTHSTYPMTKTDYLLAILCIQNLILIVLLFRRLPKLN